jgi:WD domain, G-beta repeat
MVLPGDKEDSVGAVCFSPDGSLLATTGEGGNIVLWDTSSWQRRGAIGDCKTAFTEAEGTPYMSLAFSPDGAWIACAWSKTPILFIVDVNHQRVVRHIELPARPWPQHASPRYVTRVMWAPSVNRIIVMGEAGKDSMIEVLVVDEQTETWVARGTAASFSNDGSDLLVPNKAEGTVDMIPINSRLATRRIPLSSVFDSEQIEFGHRGHLIASSDRSRFVNGLCMPVRDFSH